MLNTVLLEGLIDSYKWSKNKTGFYVTITQKRKFGNQTFTDYYVIYANDQLGLELEKYVLEHEYLAVKGSLTTYQDKKSKVWKTQILAEKILVRK
ncbi:DUF3217 domain-containing protein [Mycoplasmoides gallisepticum]|uniref:Single-stranded DNA binding protein n=3 Tax=Mycoplasmoides gallisepticum TaxID=2096 RepID=Q7NBT6_MYCGA|nr:DUF3217 domain-containing protein [Mycoplasmoides gallisepticum]AAP56524.2 single-stranded DNA binding protein [Mycoplasmoides gallisepticum str. R(low)]ADC30359.1 single-stranded DNA binding protein [Mycoplasmoides gallisepticum str. R(high)]AFP75804.1 single-stranded DNA binding protein [Mycoplasmoides gallisepticum VA94_7994-1-7P]AFP76571.1 single-stranded DNA binding protein [Mycoplasmoides gallisepticum NC95_13295-2-2P]AFP77325.1 single-stranded DNA binding protein [Mycoplasmoides gall